MSISRSVMFVVALVSPPSIVCATEALLPLYAAAAPVAQEGAPATKPVAQAAATVPDEDDAALVLAEPDFRVLNLPSTLRLPRHGSNFELTHRFNGNLRRGSFGENAGNLFGLDEGAAVGLEYRFGIARGVQAGVYRTAIDQTLQFSGQYHALQQRGAIPVSVTGLASIEAAKNFRERYSPALGLVISRMAADRLAIYATPVWVHDTAALLNVERDTFFVGIGGRARVSATVYLVAEVAPRTAGYRPGRAAFGFALEKRSGGHLFQINFNNGQGTTFGQLARGGAPNSLYLGFNLARKFF